MKSHLRLAFASLLLSGLAGNALAKTIEIDLPAPGDFTSTIDNEFWSLPVGSTFAYLAETEDGCEYNKLTVTMDTMPVTIGADVYSTRIVRDQAWESEDCDIATATMTEDTNDYYATDASGNVWYFGEATWAIDEESDDCTDEGAWLAGMDADPGIVMLGDPSSGDRYRQEYSEDNAEDWGAVLRLNARVSIDFGDYEDCLITREWTPLEPGEVEQKFYCPEPGNPPGLVFIRELKGRTVEVEYIGPNFTDGSPPGEFGAFPALDDPGVESCMIP